MTEPWTSGTFQQFTEQLLRQVANSLNLPPEIFNYSKGPIMTENEQTVSPVQPQRFAHDHNKWTFAYAYEPAAFFNNDTFDTRSDAVNAGLDAVKAKGTPNAVIYIGQLTTPDPTLEITAKAIFEIVNDGEVFQDDKTANYLSNVDPDAEMRLTRQLRKAFSDWLNAENKWPTFCTVYERSITQVRHD